MHKATIRLQRSLLLNSQLESHLRSQTSSSHPSPCWLHTGLTMMQIFQLHLSLVAQLEALKGMAHWAVYVALHLPRHSSPEWAHLRDSLVQELLMRHAPEWVIDAANKRKFLLKELQLPAAWLDQSLAQWAHYCQDDSGASCTRCRVTGSTVASSFKFGCINAVSFQLCANCRLRRESAMGFEIASLLAATACLQLAS